MPACIGRMTHTWRSIGGTFRPTESHDWSVPSGSRACRQEGEGPSGTGAGVGRLPSDDHVRHRVLDLALCPHDSALKHASQCEGGH